nr:CTP synthase [Desulfurococcales archaeon]
KTTGEQKTKPVQHSVQELRRIGIQPDIVVVRSESPLTPEARRKIALYSTLPEDHVISDYDTSTIYRVPLILEEQNYTRLVLSKLGLEDRQPDLDAWREFVSSLEGSMETVRIAMIGKYTRLRDSYISIVEALKHAGAAYRVKPVLSWVESTSIERGLVSLDEVEKESDAGIILPGFGRRGAEGKIEAVKVFRESRKPVLGICFGLQLMVVEYARNVLGLEGANSTEIEPSTSHPVIDLLPEQKNLDRLGGTMRLGAEPVRIVKGTQAWRLYEREIVWERHRHRYEVNPSYIGKLQDAGLVISGWSRRGLVEIIELPAREHPFYIASQFHAEYKSRPLSPAPLFLGLVRAARDNRGREG